MTRQTFPLLENAQSQDAPTPQSPLLGGGVIAVLVGAIVAWQLVKNRTAPATQSLQWVSQAKELEALKQYDEAVKVYDQGLQVHPNDFRLWHERGLVLARMERFEAALESYDRAFEIRPQQRDLAHERGDALLQLGRYEDAIASFDRFLRYDPDNGHILADRGYALYHLGRYEEALQDLNRVLKTEQRDKYAVCHAHFYQIEALRQLGRLETALRSSQEAVRRHPYEHFKHQQESLLAAS